MIGSYDQAGFRRDGYQRRLARKAQAEPAPIIRAARHLESQFFRAVYVRHHPLFAGAIPFFSPFAAIGVGSCSYEHPITHKLLAISSLLHRARNMIDRISMIHMMEKEEAAEVARRFAAIFLSCTSCLSCLSCSLL